MSLVGKIYGTVDLEIITAELDVEVLVSIRLTLEAYRAIYIYFEVRISLTLESNQSRPLQSHDQALVQNDYEL